MSSLPVEPDPDADVEPDLSPVALRRELRRRVRADHVDPPEGQQRPPVGGRHARRDGSESSQPGLNYVPRHSVSTPGPSSVSAHAATEQFARVVEDVTPAPPPGGSAPAPREATRREPDPGPVAPGVPGGSVPGGMCGAPRPAATVWSRYPGGDARAARHPPNGPAPGARPASLFDPGSPAGPPAGSSVGSASGPPSGSSSIGRPPGVPTGGASGSPIGPRPGVPSRGAARSPIGLPGGGAPASRAAIGEFGRAGPLTHPGATDTQTPAPSSATLTDSVTSGTQAGAATGGTGISGSSGGTGISGTSGGTGASGGGIAPAEPVQPGKRVRVVLSQRKGTPRPVRTVLDVQEMTPVGETLSTSLIRSQLALALRIGGIALIALGSLPAIFVIFPVLGRVELFGLRLPWLLLGGLSYPFMLGLGYLHARSADRLEQVFVDHIQN
ncbi:MAG: hypothetical protein ACT4O0_14845 [Pseudonocardia sp.]